MVYVCPLWAQSFVFFSSCVLVNGGMAIGDADGAAALFQSDDELQESFHGFSDGSLFIDVEGDVAESSDVEERVVQEVIEVAALEPHDNITNAQWGELKGTVIRDSVLKAYREVTVWRSNIFYLPTRYFIEELTKIINQFTTDSCFASVSLVMVTIIIPLLLQKPSPKSYCHGALVSRAV